MKAGSDDEKVLQKKLAVEIAASPGTLIPAGVGICGLMIFGFTGIPAFLSVVALLSGVGCFFVRWLRGGGKARQRVLEKLESAAQAQAEEALDRLHADLQRDGDPRTQKLLATLRALLADVRSQDLFKGVDEETTRAMRRTIGQLFDHSVESLRSSLVLVKKQEAVSSRQLRRSIQEKREELIREVSQNVDHVSALIAEIAELEEIAEQSSARVLRERLQHELDIARRVNAAMASAVDVDAAEPDALDLTDAPPAPEAEREPARLDPGEKERF